MRFYAVSLISDLVGNHGYTYFSNKADALKWKREWEARSYEAKYWGGVSDPDHPDYDGTSEEGCIYKASISVINIEPNKAGLLDALSRSSFRAEG